MAARDVLKNFNAFVDGRGYAGQVVSYTAPPLTLTTDDHKAGGMDAPEALDMGMEGLETSFGLSAYDADVLALFGVSAGSEVPFTVRGALESFDGTVKPVVHEMRGTITGIDRGEWTPGTKPTLTITMRLHYYKEIHNGRVLHEIDIRNFKRVINGVDRLAKLRQAIGM